MSSDNRGNGRLRKLVAKAPPAEPQLPLVHSTDGYLFTNALFGWAREPQPCHVFDGEPLLYTFYGRPSFRPNAGELATTMDHYLPVCLIFKQSFACETMVHFPAKTLFSAKDTQWKLALTEQTPRIETTTAFQKHEC